MTTSLTKTGKETKMANTQVYTGQNTNQGFKPNFQQQNQERSFNQNRATQVLRPNNERKGTDNTANVLLIDLSGSMEEAIGNGDNRTKLDGAKEAITQFIAGLPATAYFSLIIFSDYTKVIYPMSQMTINRNDMVREAQQMKSICLTYIVPGLEAAENEFRKAPAHLSKRLFILTDGMSSDDPTPPANRMKNSGIQINTIGFGENQVSLDEDLLKRISSVSENGTPLYTYISNATSLSGFMKKSSKTLTR